LFKDRIYLEAGIYEKITSDILFDDYQIPNLNGYEELKYFNGGELTNRGFEIMADLKAFRNDNWLVAIDFNTRRTLIHFLNYPRILIRKNPQPLAMDNIP